MSRAQGARSQVAVAFEASYGTSPASGYQRVPFASTTLSTAQPLLQSELLGYGRDQLDPQKDAITTDGDLVVPIDVGSFGIWLKAAFGDPVTTGAEAPYSHEFRSGSWDLPSLSIEKAMPEVPYFGLFAGVRVDRMSWTMQRAGLLTATLGLVAQGEAVTTVSGIGMPDDTGLKRFGHFQGAISRDGVPLANTVSTEITYANNLDRIETIRADGKIDGADPSVAMLSGRTDMRFADTTLLQQAIDGDPCELAFTYTMADASLSVVVHRVFLPQPRLEIAGPQGVQAQFDWTAAQDLVLDRSCTITLMNDVENY